MTFMTFQKACSHRLDAKDAVHLFLASRIPSREPARKFPRFRDYQYCESICAIRLIAVPISAASNSGAQWTTQSIHGTTGTTANRARVEPMFSVSAVLNFQNHSLFQPETSLNAGCSIFDECGKQRVNARTAVVVAWNLPVLKRSNENSK
jgi:hypothetical protein